MNLTIDYRLVTNLKLEVWPVLTAGKWELPSFFKLPNYPSINPTVDRHYILHLGRNEALQMIGCMTNLRWSDSGHGFGTRLSHYFSRISDGFLPVGRYRTTHQARGMIFFGMKSWFEHRCLKEGTQSRENHLPPEQILQGGGYCFIFLGSACRNSDEQAPIQFIYLYIDVKNSACQVDKEIKEKWWYFDLFFFKLMPYKDVTFFSTNFHFRWCLKTPQNIRLLDSTAGSSIEGVTVKRDTQNVLLHTLRMSCVRDLCFVWGWFEKRGPMGHGLQTFCTWTKAANILWRANPEILPWLMRTESTIRRRSFCEKMGAVPLGMFGPLNPLDLPRNVWKTGTGPWPQLGAFAWSAAWQGY